MEHITTGCSEWAHPEFYISHDPGIVPEDIGSLAAALVQWVRQGRRFESGSLIELGSTLLRVAAKGQYLTLEEPDYVKFPISWTPGPCRSLRLLRLQQNIVESVGLASELTFSPIRLSLTIGLDLSKATDGLVLQRSDPETMDSGWFLGALGSPLDYSQPGNLQRISVYQAILSWPRIAGFLALPTGCRVEMSLSGMRVARQGIPLELQQGSFLAAASA